MQTQIKPEVAITDIDAVREFLISGREIPAATSPGRKHKQKKSTVVVPFHLGITRARSRPLTKP